MKRTDRLDILHVPSELMYIPAMRPLAYNIKSIGFYLVMSIGQEFPKARARQKAIHQRTQQPNTTHTIVNLSNKRLTTAEKEVLNKGLSLVPNPKKTKPREIIHNLVKLKQMYIELYTEINQPHTKTSQTHQQQYHWRHKHQVKVKDIKEEVDRTLKLPPQPLSRTSTPHIYCLKKTHKTQCLTDPLSAQPHITTTTKQSKDW